MTKFRLFCRRAREDTLRVETIAVGVSSPKELYLRMETGDKWEGSVVLSDKQARELARRITEEFGTSEAPTEKLWEEITA